MIFYFIFMIYFKSFKNGDWGLGPIPINIVFKNDLNK